nr:MAG TPA: hypothetical protein [Caudoviricetes sp.]
MNDFIKQTIRFISIVALALIITILISRTQIN